MRDGNLELLLRVTAAIVFTLLACTGCGAIARRIGQPRVVGEMVAGILLGPTLLGAVAPGATARIFTGEVRSVLYCCGMLGLTLYMFLVGAAHRRIGRAGMVRPVAIAGAGLLVPLGIGAVAALVVVGDQRPSWVTPQAFGLFVGGALAITAFPVLARILEERGDSDTPFGRTATAAAAIDDTGAWCILALVTAMVTGKSAWSVLLTLCATVGVAFFCFRLLPKLLGPMLRDARRSGRLDARSLSILVAAILTVGFACDYIGIYSVFGGYMCGVGLSQCEGVRDLAEDAIGPVTRTLLLPLFFAFSGLNTDILAVVRTGAWVPLFILIMVAVLSKSVAAYAAARLTGWERRSALAVGALMNARGLMILIFINVGRAMGVLSPTVFAVLVMVAVVTTAMATPLYARYRGSADAEVVSLTTRRPDAENLAA